MLSHAQEQMYQTPPTVGIMVEDTDGEWIEMKNKRNILPLLAQYNNSVKRIIKTNRYKTR